jgi:hypothetical protein
MLWLSGIFAIGGSREVFEMVLEESREQRGLLRAFEVAHTNALHWDVGHVWRKGLVAQHSFHQRGEA